MRFIKMQGAGNDFVMINGVERKISDYSKLALKLCDRRFGIGGDGILVAEQSEIADIKMVYYNSDGSRGEMCGNGIRCFSKFVYEEGIIPLNKTIKIETDAGIKIAFLEVENNKVAKIKISMGKAELNSKLIPVKSDKEHILNESLKVADKIIEFSAVLLGVPHAVIFTKNLEEIDVNELGSLIENLPIFPKKINVNFVEIVDRERTKIKTWERGAGRTLACGTGSCSAVFLANHLNLVDKVVTVQTEGGELKIEIDRDEIFMTGKAEITFRGECDLWE